MATWSRLVLVVVAFALARAPFGAAAAPAEPSSFVGLVVNEEGDSITAFDPASGRVLGSTEIGPFVGMPHLAAFDPDARRLYVGGKDGRVAVLDVAHPTAPRPIASLKPGGDGEIHWVVRAAGLVWLAHQGDSAVYAYDPADLSRPAVTLGPDLGFDTTHGLALRPGTDELWATNRPEKAPGFVLRIDARAREVIGKPLQTTGRAGDRPNNVGFTPDGTRAYVVNTGSDATEVTVVDAEAFAVVGQIAQDPKRGLAPYALAFDPATGRMFVANKDGDTLSAIDVATGAVAGYVAVGDEPHGVTIGSDGRVYVAVKGDDVVAEVDPATLAIVGELRDPSLVGPHQVVFIPRGA